MKRSLVWVALLAAAGASARPRSPEECREMAQKFIPLCDRLCDKNAKRDMKLDQACRKNCREQAPMVEKRCVHGNSKG